jgi:hypothetical protein
MSICEVNIKIVNNKRCGLWWEGLYKRGTTVIKDEVLITVGCSIFPSILIAKYLFIGSLKKNQLII